ncbi:hypothetical protein SK128_010952 [Halocaridina rubra]|uniref:Uncharacterized protein n=1 Tax=Halocaridina rubra TaxID=373956 RepID=A0AAN9AAI1_HALRR
MSVQMTVVGFFVLLALHHLAAAAPPPSPTLSHGTPIRSMPPMTLNFRKNPRDGFRNEVGVAVYINESDCECRLPMEPCLLELVFPDEESGVMATPCEEGQKYCCKMQVNIDDIEITSEFEEKTIFSPGSTSEDVIDQDNDSHDFSRQTSSLEETSSEVDSFGFEEELFSNMKADEDQKGSDMSILDRDNFYSEQDTLTIQNYVDDESASDIISDTDSLRHNGNYLNLSDSVERNPRPFHSHEENFLLKDYVHDYLTSLDAEGSNELNSYQYLPDTYIVDMGVSRTILPYFSPENRIPLNASTQHSSSSLLSPSDFHKPYSVSQKKYYESLEDRDFSLDTLNDSSSKLEKLPELSTFSSGSYALSKQTPLLNKDAWKHLNNDFKSLKKRDITPTSILINTSSTEQRSRESKMLMCSCSTRDDCLSTWSLFRDLPKVNIRTTLRCENPEVTCCFGEIIPPRNFKTLPDLPRNRNNSNASDEKNNNKTASATLWTTPSVTSALHSVLSWLFKSQ